MASTLPYKTWLASGVIILLLAAITIVQSQEQKRLNRQLASQSQQISGLERQIQIQDMLVEILYDECPTINSNLEFYDSALSGPRMIPSDLEQLINLLDATRSMIQRLAITHLIRLKVCFFDRRDYDSEKWRRLTNEIRELKIAQERRNH